MRKTVRKFFLRYLKGNYSYLKKKYHRFDYFQKVYLFTGK